VYPNCQLNQPNECCHGLGISLKAGSTTIVAELCHCVMSCPACLGQARVIEGASSKPCRKVEPRKLVSSVNNANMPIKFINADVHSFTNFSGNGRKKLAEVLTFVEGYQRKNRGLLISGPVGIGKSHLMVGITKALIERGYSVKFADFFQLIGELKAGFSEGKADTAQLAPLMHVDVLVIDELGKGRNNDFELTILDQLVWKIFGNFSKRVKTVPAIDKANTFPSFSQRSRDKINRDHFTKIANVNNTARCDSAGNDIGFFVTALRYDSRRGLISPMGG